MKLLRKLARLRVGILMLALVAVKPAMAGPYSDVLGRRLVESTTSEDKVLLMRWMFALLSLHPEFKDMSIVTPQQRSDLNRQVAKMFQDLITVKCAKEAREAVRYEGMAAIQESFQILGQVAGREIFANPQVSAGAAEMGKYIDDEKIKKILLDDPTQGK